MFFAVQNISELRVAVAFWEAIYGTSFRQKIGAFKLQINTINAVILVQNFIGTYI